MSTLLCPKCTGQGTVARPPWVPGDVREWTCSTTGPYVCDLCEGSKVIEFVLHSTHLPSRGSDVEAWIREHRDRAKGYGDRQGGLLLDSILDDYRLRADTGRTLRDEPDSEGVL